METIDKRYEGAIRAILRKQGVMKLEEINEYNILKEFKNLTDKENQHRSSLKNKFKGSNSPTRDITKSRTIDRSYMTSLLPRAKSRQVSLLMGGGVPKLKQPANGTNKNNGGTASLYSTESDDETVQMELPRRHTTINKTSSRIGRGRNRIDGA